MIWVESSGMSAKADEAGFIIAAIAPVSGGYFRGKRCNPPRLVPVVTFHGTADNLLPTAESGYNMSTREVTG